MDTVCDECKRSLELLETYIRVCDVVICDECYMNMSTRDFIEKIGGEILVVC